MYSSLKRLFTLCALCTMHYTLVNASTTTIVTPQTVDTIFVVDTVISSQSTGKSYVDIVADWYDRNMNYATITALMTVESSFIPFPSEIVVPPAAAVATRPDSNLNIPLIILFATLGAIIGALINYFLALTLGRPIIYRFADSRLGRLCLLNSDKIRHAEDYFNNHGKVSTFVGRLIPGIRQLISIPAGLARMPLIPFILFTALGAATWNSILALIGYLVGDNMELINRYSHEIGYTIIAIIAIIAIYYIIKHLRHRQSNNNA